MDSLFANKIFLLNLIKVNVGSSPAMPGIADTVISTFLIYFSIKKKLFKTINLFNLFNFFIFRYTDKLLIIIIFGLKILICNWQQVTQL